jgi:hypothetical protein
MFRWTSGVAGMIRRHAGISGFMTGIGRTAVKSRRRILF